MSKKRDFSLVVWAFGWLLSLATLIRKQTQKLEVPFEAFEWLVSDKGELTLERVVRTIKEGYEAELKKLLGNVVYGVSVEQLRDSYRLKAFGTQTGGKFIDVIDGLPTSGLYSLEFETLDTNTSQRSIDGLRAKLAKNGKRFATLSEALQLMIDGQNGRSITNWHHVHVLGTVYEASGEEDRQPGSCYVHNDMDGMDYGQVSVTDFREQDEVTLLIVKSSTFIRDAKAA